MHICIYVYVWVYVYVCPWTSQCRRYVLELRYTRKYRESSFEQPCVLFLSEAHSFRSFLLLSHAPLFPFLIRVTPTTILHLSHTYLFISHPSTRNSRALLVPNFKFLELSLRFLYIACTWSFFALLKSPFRIRFVIKKTVQKCSLIPRNRDSFFFVEIWGSMRILEKLERSRGEFV